MSSDPSRSGLPARQRGGGLDHFFDTVRRQGVVRLDPHPIAGVCAGLAARLGVAPGVVRLVAFLLAFTSVGLLAYGVAWLLLPDTRGEIEAEEFLRRGRVSGSLLAAVFLTLLGLSGLGVIGSGAEGNLGWVLVALLVIALGVYRLRRGGEPAAIDEVAPSIDQPRQAWPAVPEGRPTVSLVKHADPAAPPPDQVQPAPTPALALDAPVTQRPAERPSFRPRRRPAAGPRVVGATSGAMLILLGAALLVQVRGVRGLLGVDWAVWATTGVLLVLGLVTIAVGLNGRRAGGLIGLSVLALLALVVGGVGARGYTPVLNEIRSSVQTIVQTSVQDSSEPNTAQFEDTTWTVTGPVLQNTGYTAELGNGTLDLTGVTALPAGQEPRTITLDAALGGLTVNLPEGLGVDLIVADDSGSVRVDGNRVEPGRHRVGTTTGQAAVILQADASIGDIALEQVDR